MLRALFLLLLTGPTVVHMDTAVLPLPLLSPLVIAYGFSYCDLSEQNGGKENLVVRRWGLWQYVLDYFSLRLVKTVDLDPHCQYVFGIHPHSILPFGAIIGLGINLESLFPAVSYRVLAATFVFYVPIYRDICLWGGIVDAARYSALRVLRSGKSVALVPGGATEALHTDPDRDVVVLRKRRGFIKLALEHGASLVPVFSFNECNTYSVLKADAPLIRSIAAKFQRMTGLSLPLITNIWPRKSNITVVFGKPIPVPRIPNPDSAVVDEYLEAYITGLEELYTENAATYNNPPTKPPLEIL